MKIINNSIPSINTYDPRNPTITWSNNFPAGANAMRSINTFDAEGWYCLFSCQHSFKIYKISDIIDNVSLKKILNKEAFLVLDNTLEPFEKSIDTIYENIIIKENIPASQIILMTNMYDAKKYSRELSKKLNQDEIRIFWYSVFEKDLHHAVDLLYLNQLPNTLVLKKYSKKFLYFNRRWRLHRPFLIALLYGKNLLEKGHVSFGPCDNKDTWGHRWPELTYYFRNDSKMMDLLTTTTNVQSLPPLYLDTDKLSINRAIPTVDTNTYYEETYFSIVSETTYFTKEWYNSARFLSEKTFKPIAMKHPFILVSVPNSLEILRIMGYKTFSSIINEEYDLELDDGKRMLMILNEIERLSNLNQEELSDFLIKATEICNYNYNILMSKTEFIKELQ
jgi:hypothetical protein